MRYSTLTHALIATESAEVVQIWRARRQRVTESCTRTPHGKQ